MDVDDANANGPEWYSERASTFLALHRANGRVNHQAWRPCCYGSGTLLDNCGHAGRHTISDWPEEVHDAFKLAYARSMGKTSFHELTDAQRSAFGGPQLCVHSTQCLQEVLDAVSEPGFVAPALEGKCPCGTCMDWLAEKRADDDRRAEQASRKRILEEEKRETKRKREQEVEERKAAQAAERLRREQEAAQAAQEKAAAKAALARQRADAEEAKKKIGRAHV